VADLDTDPRHTLVILLGASEYPGDPAWSNPRFAHSAEAVRAYFTDPARFGLPPANGLWLFDTSEAPPAVYDRIEEFLRSALARPAPERPRDAIIYYVGHGFPGDDRSYHLATRTTKRNAQEFSYRFRALQRTVKQHAGGLRKYYLIDACFSGAALKELMGPVTEKLVAEAREEAADDLPGSGTALLCASPPDDHALAPEAEAHTMFTGALLDVLAGAGVAERLSLRQLHARAAALIGQRFQAYAVQPQIHAPEQKDGDIGVIPLFPVGPQHAAALADGRDALNPASFADDGAIYALVVRAPAPAAKGSMVLEEQIQLAWNDQRTDVLKAVDRYRKSMRLPAVPVSRADGGLVILTLRIEQAFDTPDVLRAAVQALCRCEIAVFDLTDYDPGVLFLLGIRAVARRGVTLSSIGGRYVIGGALKVPFNLQLLNLAAHSTAQLDKGEGVRPHDLIGGKLKTGFNDLTDLPHYLDLPAFDSVRQLGVEPSAYKPIRYTHKVLLLCPFGKEYTARNWKLHLGLALSGHVKEYGRRATPPEEAKTRVERLLDVKTPRLVAQSLFEAIRLTDLCLIDWTGLRPNVMFEAGVRLATNALGAVHIVEADASPAPALRAHVNRLMRLFAPVPYRCEPGQVPYDEMIRRFDASLRDYGNGRYGFVFDAVGALIDARTQSVALPLVDELLRGADMLSSPDEESEGVSQVLFHEVNRALTVAAKEAAAERRLAAWLYLSQRFSAADVVRDARLLDQFQLLRFQVKRWARNAERRDLLASIKAFEQAVATAQNPTGDSP